MSDVTRRARYVGHWSEHRLFAGAGEVVACAAEVDAVVLRVGALASSYDPRACARAIADIFHGEPVWWPAYDQWRAEKLQDGFDNTVFGSIADPAELRAE